MTAFREDGHLSVEALAALAGNQDVFDETERLEAAEHLAFCDDCLQRYTELLEDGAALLVPANSCQRTLWARIRTRAIQTVTSRYATAAAAVALALTVLWSGGPRVGLAALPEDRPSISRQLSEMTGEAGDSLREAMSNISGFFDLLFLKEK